MGDVDPVKEEEGKEVSLSTVLCDTTHPRSTEPTPGSQW